MGFKMTKTQSYLDGLASDMQHGLPMTRRDRRILIYLAQQAVVNCIDIDHVLELAYKQAKDVNQQHEDELDSNELSIHAFALRLRDDIISRHQDQ